MSNTYCGKSCADCSNKTYLNCSGCQTASGTPADDKCKLAQCCFEKGHDTCDTCDFNNICVLLQNRNQMRNATTNTVTSINAKITAIPQNAPVLALWLRILFWLYLGNIIVGLLSNDYVINFLPALRIPTMFLSPVISFVCCFILIFLGTEEHHYRVAGICSLISQLLGFLSSWFGSSFLFIVLVSIATLILSLVATYQEFVAHAGVLTRPDSNLALRWLALWKWYIIFLSGLVVSIFLMFLIPLLANILLFVCAIGIFALEIGKLVYLYQTSARFQNL